jgi:biotin synthase
MDSTFLHISSRASVGARLARADLLAIGSLAESDPYAILHLAHRARTNHFGNRVSLCCIVPGKVGGCTEDCKWCAQVACNMPARQTPISQISQAGAEALQAGASSLGIVNSGRRPLDAEMSAVLEAARRLRDEHGRFEDGGLRVCAGLGELTPDQARKLVDAGVRRYNMNLETSRRFYPQVVTTHTYDDRLKTIETARDAGLEICCGGLFGIGETWEDRVDLAMELRHTVKPASVNINFLHPIRGSALADAKPLTPMEALTIIALFRLALPTTDVKVAGGRATILRDMQSWIFYAGATSCMIGNYLTTSGRGTGDDRQMLDDLGLKVVRSL